MSVTRHVTVIYRPIWSAQPKAVVSQPNPIQNQWYSVLDATNSKLYTINFRVQGVGETIQVQATIDGHIFADDGLGIAAVAGNWYVTLIAFHTVPGELQYSPSGWPDYFNMALHDSLEGKQVKIEIRKITNNGNGTLDGVVCWAKMT